MVCQRRGQAGKNLAELFAQQSRRDKWGYEVEKVNDGSRNVFIDNSSCRRDVLAQK